MTKIMQILWLKLSLYTLNTERDNALLDIAVKQPIRASRVNTLEDIRPSFFKEIDKKINYKKRQLEVISRRRKKSVYHYKNYF